MWLILTIFVLVNYTQAQFCPKPSEANPRCLSHSAQYKCGAFFLNLPEREELTWIAALPDVFRKINLRKNPEIRETLGGATPGSFNLTQGECSEDHKLANARCFATMLKLRSTPFESCAKNVINEGSDDTLGNILCEKVSLFYNKNPPLSALEKGIKIGFYHSECGSDWEPTGNPDGPLRYPKRLCCIQDENSGRMLQVACRGARTPVVSC